MATSSTSSSTSTSTSTASILSSLGAGSGIDTGSLITKLVSATYDPKDAALTTKETANTSQISSLATLGNEIDAFSTSLNTLITGGSLRTQPSSSDTAVLTATAQAGASLGSLSAQLTVKQIAKSQSLVSGYLGTSSTAVGNGGFTLTVGTGSTAKTASITLDSSNNTVAGIAAAINSANVGVTATVITDATGARLQIKGATGAASAFTLTPTAGSDSGVIGLAWPQNSDGTGMTQAQAAQDAIITSDGVDVSRSTNTVSDLITGVTLNLVKAAPDETITLGATRPTDAITSAVNDFVSAYNTLKADLTTATASATSTTAAGPFAGDSGIRNIMTQLSRLTSTVLNSASSPSTLAEIGVATQKDGTLTVNSATLSKMLANYPDGVEALFNPTQHSSSPLIQITSAMGATKAGTYQLTNIVPANGSTPASGSIAGLSGQPNGSSLYASSVSDATGLVIFPTGSVASATITVDPGIGGALQAIRDSLRSSTGLLQSMSDTLTTQKTALADQRTKMLSDEAAYKDRLTTQFTNMDTAVAAYKSTQSYLTQQIAQWNKSS